MVPCDRCPLASHKAFRKFTPEELRFVQRFKIGEARVEAGRTVLVEGEDSPYLFTVLSGWAIKHKSLADGRRQIINFALPGDMTGLQAAMFDKMQHSVQALTDVVLCVFDRSKIWKLYEAQSSPKKKREKRRRKKKRKRKRKRSHMWARMSNRVRRCE